MAVHTTRFLPIWLKTRASKSVCKMFLGWRGVALLPGPPKSLETPLGRGKVDKQI